MDDLADAVLYLLQSYDDEPTHHVGDWLQWKTDLYGSRMAAANQLKERRRADLRMVQGTFRRGSTLMVNAPAFGALGALTRVHSRHC